MGASGSLMIVRLRNGHCRESPFAFGLLRLSETPSSVFVSAASNIPGRPFNQNPVFATHEPQQRIAASEALVDYDFFDVLNVEFSAGRPFARENPADRDAFFTTL